MNASPTHSLQTSEVLRFLCQLCDIDSFRDFAQVPKLGTVNIENLHSSLLVWQPNLDLQLQSTGPEKGFVDHVFPVCHTNQKNVFDRVHSINFAQQLVDNTVVYLNVATDVNRASVLTRRNP